MKQWKYQTSFLLFAESLKLVRKADVEKEDVNVINDVYTDLLPNNSIISKFNLPQTSILMGRKGTGKSTIIQKSMFDVAKLDDRLYKIYDKMETLDSQLIEARAKRSAIESEKITGDNIYKVLIYFEKLYTVMNEVERRQLIEALISEIQIFEERQPNGQWLKSIKFKLTIQRELHPLRTRERNTNMNNLEYIRNGDYLIPNLILSEQSETPHNLDTDKLL